MGRAARAKAQRRRADFRPARRGMAAHRADLSAESVALRAAAEQIPEIKAGMEADAQDAELLARVDADLPAQQARLRRDGWRQREQFLNGAGVWDHPRRDLRLLHTVARSEHLDGRLWGHVSVSRRDLRLPSWEETRDAQWLIYPDETGVIVVASRSEHVTLREVMHVWTCLDGSPVPDFGRFGTI